MSNNLVFDEWYGYLLPEQAKLYRKHNVSPADHQMILDLLGYQESDRAAIICHVLRHIPNGQYHLPLGATQ